MSLMLHAGAEPVQYLILLIFPCRTPRTAVALEAAAIAERITGAHWSGPRFFGLRRGSPPPVQVPRHGQ